MATPMIAKSRYLTPHPSHSTHHGGGGGGGGTGLGGCGPGGGGGGRGCGSGGSSSSSSPSPVATSPAATTTAGSGGGSGGGGMAEAAAAAILGELALSQEWMDCQQKSRRRSTIHSYSISTTYHTLPQDAKTLRQVRHMTEGKAMKNIFSISIAFMFVFTGFVSLQSLQSTLHAAGGVGVASLSVVYGSTVLSCLLAPWLINRLTTKWTVVLAFSLYFAYFAANFYPNSYLLLTVSLLLGALAGPMWSAQATYVTTLALTFAQHRRMGQAADETINKFMGIFFGFFRSSQIWGNLISALVTSKNGSHWEPHAGRLDFAAQGEADGAHFWLEAADAGNGTASNVSQWEQGGGDEGVVQRSLYGDVLHKLLASSSPSSSFSSFPVGSRNGSLSSVSSTSTQSTLCGVSTCLLNSTSPFGVADGIYSNPELGLGVSGLDMIPESTKYMLLTTCLGCGLMGVVIVVALVDQVKVGKRNADPEFSLTSFELFMSTLKMLKDSKCCLLIPLVVFMGLEQGFMFSDFTKSYVSCSLGFRNIGPILICFGASSAVSSVSIGYVARHIKRFAFIAAGATFNVGLLIVLALWSPKPHDVPNFYVVAGCLGLCDAIWQTQTYTLFGVLFSHKQEAAFATYRMFHAMGCAMAFGYSYFLCVATKVYIMSGCLTLGLTLYTVIEMRVQLQSQHIQDIVAL